MKAGAPVALFAVLVTALTYFVFPGHTYLQQDTQIYVPMIDQLIRPELFTRDLITSRPHLGWTFYDEATLLVHYLVRLDVRAALTLQQWIFRASGVWGVFLIGTSFGFTRRLAMFIAAVFSLGVMVVGPQVLTVEYEPVPRGFALPLVLCAMGLALHGRLLAAGAASSIALLYHAPTTAAFWLVFAVLLWRAREWRPLAMAIATVSLLYLSSRLQPGLAERQPLLSILSPELKELQRMRAGYNWVSLWPRELFANYAVLSLIVTGAIYYLRKRLSQSHVILFGGLVCAAIASVPFSYATLEGLGWSLIPQFQPARTVLFIPCLAIILSMAAAIDAGSRRHYAHAFLWMLVPFILPVHQLVTPPYTKTHAVVIAFLAAAATAAIAVHRVAPRRAAAALAMAGLMAYFGIPLVGGVHNYPALWNPNITAVANWAQANTPPDALFHFAHAGKDLHPGIFRAQSQRAVYVDWKGGGQVNYFEDLALAWWERWRSTALRDAPPTELAARGIDYFIAELPNVPGGMQPLYSNAGYAVYAVPKVAVTGGAAAASR